MSDNGSTTTTDSVGVIDGAGSAPTEGRDPVAALDAAQASVAISQRRLLEAIATCERAQVWRRDHCRDLEEWLCARLGITRWAARRWISAAHVLPQLPHITRAFTSGRLCLDKVVELCRFATPATEAKLVSWACRVTAATIRRKADVATRSDLDEIKDIDRSRSLTYWWYEDGRRLGLEGHLPADQGAVLVAAIDRVAGRLPDIVSDDEDQTVSFTESLEARRADALVALASAHIATDQDPDRATVVVHAELDALVGEGNGETENGGVLHAEVIRRLCCDARIELALHGRDGGVVGVGRSSRIPPGWLRRQLRYRDRGCTFPGCGAQRFLHAHHIEHWIPDGHTNLDNLVLVCSSHHKLVHEYRWRVRLDEDGARWFRPDGREFEPGPKVLERAPPEQLVAVA